jgi:hypothetical protein
MHVTARKWCHAGHVEEQNKFHSKDPNTRSNNPLFRTKGKGFHRDPNLAHGSRAKSSLKIEASALIPDLVSEGPNDLLKVKRMIGFQLLAIGGSDTKTNAACDL